VQSDGHLSPLCDLGARGFELYEARFEGAAGRSEASAPGNVFADEQAIPVDDERPADHGWIGEVFATVEDRVGAAAQGACLCISLSREQGWRLAFVNCGPSGDDFAVPSKGTQTDPFRIDQIADLVEPAMGDQSDNVVARPADLIVAARRLDDIHVEAKTATIYMEPPIRRPADPPRQGNDATVKGRLGVGPSIQWDANIRLRVVPQPALRQRVC
jgi:hypothetical protein